MSQQRGRTPQTQQTTQPQAIPPTFPLPLPLPNNPNNPHKPQVSVYSSMNPNVPPPSNVPPPPHHFPQNAPPNRSPHTANQSKIIPPPGNSAPPQSLPPPPSVAPSPPLSLPPLPTVPRPPPLPFFSALSAQTASLIRIPRFLHFHSQQMRINIQGISPHLPTLFGLFADFGDKIHPSASPYTALYIHNILNFIIEDLGNKCFSIQKMTGEGVEKGEIPRDVLRISIEFLRKFGGKFYEKIFWGEEKIGEFIENEKKKEIHKDIIMKDEGQSELTSLLISPNSSQTAIGKRKSEEGENPSAKRIHWENQNSKNTQNEDIHSTPRHSPSDFVWISNKFFALREDPIKSPPFLLYLNTLLTNSTLPPSVLPPPTLSLLSFVLFSVLSVLFSSALSVKSQMDIFLLNLVVRDRDSQGAKVSSMQYKAMREQPIQPIHLDAAMRGGGQFEERRDRRGQMAMKNFAEMMEKAVDTQIVNPKISSAPSLSSAGFSLPPPPLPSAFPPSLVALGDSLGVSPTRKRPTAIIDILIKAIEDAEGTK